MTDTLIEIAEEMERIFHQQMVKTPIDLQNLSEDAKKIGKMYCYAADKWAARIRAWVEANKCANCGANPPHYCYSCWEKSK